MNPATAQQHAVPAERRRANRAALRLSATVRDGGRSRVKVRIIDMSTHGCRIECPAPVADDSWIWLGIAGLESQYCRVVWHCHEFVGLEFATPLAEAVFGRLLRDHGELPETAIRELRDIASRTNRLARQAGDGDIRILADISRQCSLDAVVEGLRIDRSAARGRPTRA